MRNVEDDPFDRRAVIDLRIGVLVREERQMKSVSSLTDRLLGETFSDWRMDRLKENEVANEQMSLLAYHLESMKGAALCHVPPEAVEEGSEFPQIDVAAMTAIGAAMAMLILSVIQNELMLNTQLEAVKGTQNQKLAASQTKMLQVRQQIQKSRYKSGFQKFMDWLTSTWVWKFLNSNYGKAIMFIIGAAVTIASFGSAGPAVIAISCVLLGFQAAELILGKSMGELLTQSMADGPAKMAIQMSIDVGLMVADMAVGAGGAASVDKVASAAEEGVEMAQKTAKAVQQIKGAAEAAETAAKATNKAADVVDAAQDVQKIADEAVDALDEVAKVSSELQNLILSGSSAADIADKTKELEKAMDKVNEMMDKLDASVNNLKNVASGLDVGDDVGDAVKSAKEAMDNALGSAQELQESAAKTVKEVHERLGEKVDDVAEVNTADNAPSQLDQAKPSAKENFFAAVRFVAGIRGLEHLSRLQQIVVALQKFQQRIQALMELYQALYKLASSEEEARNVICAGKIEAINTESDAQQEFLQMIIDHQLSDIQSLMSHVKSSFERAAEVIREYGETNREVVQNIRA
jgi:uncharacterized protein YukE